MTVKIKTQYIAPLSLWVVVRRRVLKSGPFIEPAWTLSEMRNDMSQHQRDEDDEMQSGEGFGQSLVVACEPAKTVGPTEAAFDHPAPGKQYETFLRLGQFDDLQLAT